MFNYSYGARVSTDDDFPWRVLGGQQDNSAVRLRTRSFADSVIGPDDWEETAGGESGHVVARPGEPDVVFGGSYAGFLMRYDHRSGELRLVNVWPDDPMGGGAEGFKYRFKWNYPLFFSPHDANKLYAAANVLFATTDGGQTWKALSGDLTRNDPAKLGPVDRLLYEAARAIYGEAPPHASLMYVWDVAGPAGTATRIAQAIKKAMQPAGMTLLQANELAGLQTVFHFHIHVLPRHTNDGLAFTWPLKRPPREELENYAAQIRAALMSA